MLKYVARLLSLSSITHVEVRLSGGGQSSACAAEYQWHHSPRLAATGGNVIAYRVRHAEPANLRQMDARESAYWRAGAASADNELRFWRAHADELRYLLELAINGLRMNDRADRMEVDREIGQQTGILPKPKPEPLIEAAIEVVRNRNAKASTANSKP